MDVALIDDYIRCFIASLNSIYIRRSWRSVSRTLRGRISGDGCSVAVILSCRSMDAAAAAAADKLIDE